MSVERINEISKLHRQMRKLTLDAGVGEKRYESLATRLEKKHSDTLDRILAFLKDVSGNEYCEVHRIWNLPTMTQEVWDNYITLFDDVAFEELVLLRAARKKLKARYAEFFRGGKK